MDNGTVALEDGYVEEMGLPAAQRFPWDQDKGLYLLNGFHSMHCLVGIPFFGFCQSHKKKTTECFCRRPLDKQYCNSIKASSEASQLNIFCIAWMLYARTYYAMLMILLATQASNPVVDQGLDKCVNARIGVSSKRGLNLIPPVGDTQIRTTPTSTHCGDTNFVRMVRHTLQR